ncbi:MAG: IS66 family transposase [Bacteroidetes bacterium]|nr:MAG: IS66 family transposase [Bacteroidota bacterium]
MIRDLQIEIQFLKNGRKSDTSSTPSSQDYGRSNKYNSREKSNRKCGGQIGHKGSSLKMSKTPDEIQKHIPVYCKKCGGEFDADTVFELYQRKQEVVIPPIKAKFIEHQSYCCTCSKCNTQTTTDLPSHLKANIQYGRNIQALITYLSVYQYMPSNRIKSYLKDIMNIPISEGTIYNIIESMSNKAKPVYEIIKEKIVTSKVVGGDESGVKINGSKAWFWVFQNPLYTFIKVAYSRGYKTIIETFSNGFPMSIYVSDSLAAQLKINTKAKQLCLAHLMRELKSFENAFNCTWSPKLKQLFKDAISYKKQMTVEDYLGTNQKIKGFENQLTELLQIECSGKHKKLRAFIKRLIKNRGAVLTFLYHLEVPPDNNGSERAIRNAKVKMKISNQFKSFEFANHYAVIRSVIDTTIKNSKNVFDALSCLANQKIITAES